MTVPAAEEIADTGREVSEWELRERQEREEELRAVAEVLGAGEEPSLFLQATWAWEAIKLTLQQCSEGMNREHAAGDLFANRLGAV